MRNSTTVAERISRLAHLSARHLSLTPPLPRSIKFESNNVCNLNCSFCFRSEGKAPALKMATEDCRKMMGKLRRAGVEELGVFLWNEPFTDRRLPAIVEMAKDEFGFRRTYVTTNGTLSHNMAESLRNLDSLKISVNAKDKNEFAELTGRSSNLFAKMLENIKRIRQTRDEVEADTGHRCQLSASWIRLHPGREALMQPVLGEVGQHVDHVYSLASYAIEAGQLSEKQLDAGWTVCIGNPGTGDDPHPPVPCHILFRFSAINVDCCLCACAFHHGERNSSFVVGSLLDDSLENLWHSKKMQDLRAAHLRAWETGDMAPVLDTICGPCLTPQKGQTGLLPGQPPFLPRDQR